MINYLVHSAIDKIRWDKLIASSPQGVIYASSWYLDIVSPGWEALVDDDYLNVFPLTQRKKFGIHYLFQPYFTQQLGLFGREVLTDETKAGLFIDCIPEKFRLIEIQLNYLNSISERGPFTITRRLTHHLDLNREYAQIKSNYSENLSRNIKKSLKMNIRISEEVSYNDTIQLFRENRGASITNLHTSDYRILVKILSEAKNRNLIVSKGVVNSSGKLIAGAIFLKSFHSYIFLFSAVSEEGRESGAMSLLIDSFISSHSNENMFLDFEGSMDVNLARFYKGFGSKEIVYLQIRKNKLPLLLRWLK